MGALPCSGTLLLPCFKEEIFLTWHNSKMEYGIVKF